jgi:hypothetical protein
VAYGSAQAYPPQPGWPTGAGAAAPWINPSWLAASADRERAVGVLRAGFAEGRLSQDELDDRVARAYAARTYGELWALTADLPAGPFAVPHGPIVVPAQNAPEPSGWRPAAALVITALIIFTLAALITAIVTAHTGQAVGYQNQQGGVQVQVVPYGPFQVSTGIQQGAVLTPYITHQPGHWNGHRGFRTLTGPPGP